MVQVQLCIAAGSSFGFITVSDTGGRPRHSVVTASARNRCLNIGGVLGSRFDLLNIIDQDQRPKGLDHKATYDVT